VSAHFSINLDATSAHIHDIRGYSEFRAAELAERFTLDSEEELLIANKVTEASKGCSSQTQMSTIY
jgi:hypothetical protein